MDEILRKTQKLHGFTEEDVVKVVQNNDKQRFATEREDGGRLKIRANQGHTIEVSTKRLKLHRANQGHTIEVPTKILKLHRANQGHTIEVSTKILKLHGHTIEVSTKILNCMVTP